jgi:hypothetical protein
VTAAAVNSALIRARPGLRPDRDPYEVPLPKSPAEAAAIERFVDAFERFDLDRLVALLTQDARLTMPPEPFELRGPLAIAGFLQETHFWGQAHKLIPTRANGQPALVFYLADPCAPIWRASSFVVLTLRGNQVSVITRFSDRGCSPASGFPVRCRETDGHRPIMPDQFTASRRTPGHTARPGAATGPARAGPAWSPRSPRRPASDTAGPLDGRQPPGTAVLQARPDRLPGLRGATPSGAAAQ